MSINNNHSLEAIQLLKRLIKTPSFSKLENKTADMMTDFFGNKGIKTSRHQHNIWVKTPDYNPELPTLLLNSHHDTVKPVTGWKRDPFSPTVEKDILFGLGSNDAGASLVSLGVVFLHYYNQKSLPINLIFLASAEEEISGKNGVEAALPKLGKIDFGIVGEPTQMKMATAEKGLIVIDAVAHGKAGHAARDEGNNAIYLALNDIHFLQNFQLPKISTQLGLTKISVTQINAGTQHNVVPDECRFVIDVRTTDQYSNQEVLKILQEKTTATLTPRSLRLNASGISLTHPLIRAGQSVGISIMGSATLSDQALMSFPTVKMGPGKSERSHTADEFIHLSEIKEGINIYQKLIDELCSFYKKQSL